MLYALLLMTLVLSVSVGNLALGFGLAVHFGHGPAEGWKALCFWKRHAAAPHGDASHDAQPEAAAPAPAHSHGH